MSQTPEIPDAEADIVELAAAAHLTGLTWQGSTVGKATFGVTRVGLDLADLVNEHGTVVACRRVGGNRSGWQLVARLAIEVYTNTYTSVWAVQNAVEAHLADRWRKSPAGYVRLDRWHCESAAAVTQYPGHDVLTSVWRVSTRDLP